MRCEYPINKINDVKRHLHVNSAQRTRSPTALAVIR